MPFRVYVFASDPAAANPITGLTLTDFEVDIWRVNKSTQVQNQVVPNGNLTREIGEGFYLYVLSSTDDETYDYFATVKYTGATLVNTTLWAGTDASSGVTQSGSLLSFDCMASFTENPVTALTLSDFEVDIFRINKTDNQVTQIATAVAMSVEVGDGHYAYYLTNQNFVTNDYLVLVQYEGATALDSIVWTGKPLGDIPSPSATAASYRRVLPRTLLPLDRWAEIIGIDPRHFRQVETDVKPSRTCSQVWKQYSWQEADQVGRYDVADAIQQAEKTIAQYLGYKLLPTYEVAERVRAPKPGNPELLRYTTYDPRGYHLAVRAKWGYFVEAGQEVKALIQAGVGITHSDRDSDGYFETCTIEFPTTVTDEEEIGIFYPDEDGADEWEIRSLRDVTISGGVCTVTFWLHQTVNADLIEALDPRAADGDDTNLADFLTTVDVYRRYNDPETQCTLIWDPNIINCSYCSNTDSACCPVCGQGTQTGCLMPKDYEAGWLMYRPASYSAGTWTSETMTCGRNPDQLLMYYRAGLEDMSRNWPRLQMDPQWERAVAYYALALLDRDVCDCAPIKGISDKWREDLARQTSQGSSLQITDNVMNNPLGTTRAAQLVWNMIKERDRRLASPVIY